MTRDEAIAKYKAAIHHPTGVNWCGSATEATAALAKIDREAAAYVDVAAALGILKLDEPKSIRQRVTDVLAHISSVDRHTDNIIPALDRAGLKIVEK